MAETTPLPAAPPIYRHLLSGAPDAFRPSLRATLLLTGCGAVLLSMAGFGRGDWVTRLPSALATLATALLIAALATRWLGRRIGWLSGLVYLTSAGTLVPSQSAGTDALLGLSVTAAMGAFGLGNAAGGFPLRDEPWVARAFYAAAGVSFLLAGPAGALFILAACLLFLCLGEDSRGLRFLASPSGLLIFALLAVAWPVTLWLARPAGWDGRWELLYGWFSGAPGPGTSLPDLLGSLGLATLPWTPFAVLALAGGLWRGHAATPAWRLFGCWALAPLALMAVGLSCGVPHLGVLLPPVAVMAAAGLNESLPWIRRRTYWIRTASTSAEPRGLSPRIPTAPG